MSTIASVDLSRSGNRLFVKHPGVFQQFSSSSSTLKCQSFRANHALLSLTIGQRSNFGFSGQPCRNKIVCNSSVPGAPNPSGAQSWRGWMIGMVLSLIIPFWRNKWAPLLALKKEVDTFVDTVEAVVEVVEQVAEKVEDVADDIGNHLPADGKLRAAVDLIENLAGEAAKGAHLADQLIEKAEEMEDKVEDFFESVIDQAGDVTKEVGAVEPNVEAEKKISDV